MKRGLVATSLRQISEDASVANDTTSISEITRVSSLAVKALKAYHSCKTRWLSEERAKPHDLLTECYTELKKLLVHYIEVKDFVGALHVYILLAEVAFYANDYVRSIKYYTQAEILAEIYQKYEEQAELLERIGHCYIKLKEYELALMAFKSQLKVSWLHNRRNIELMAYDNMGMAYYYMGNIDYAQHYHSRMSGKIIEPASSLQKAYCIENEEARKQKSMLQETGDNKLEFNAYMILKAETLEERADLLLRQFIISTEGDETPRIIRYEPMRYVKRKELPSPRSTRVSTPSFLKTSRSSLGALKQQRIFLVKLKQHTNSKRTVTKEMSTVKLTPKVFLTHLSSARSDTSKPSEERFVMGTCDKITGFPYIVNQKRTQKLGLNSPPVSSTRYSNWMRRNPKLLEALASEQGQLATARTRMAKDYASKTKPGK